MAVLRTHRGARRSARLVRVALLALILSTMLAPSAAASLDVRPGQTAAIVATGGDPINLRAKPRTSGDVLARHWEGMTADVLEGPIWDDAGNAWYKVVIDGTRGYMAAEFLDVPGGSSGGGDDLDPITGSATIANTGGDPIRYELPAHATATDALLVLVRGSAQTSLRRAEMAPAPDPVRYAAD